MRERGMNMGGTLKYADHKLDEAIKQGEPDETIAYWRGYRDCAKALQQTCDKVATGCKPLTQEQLQAMKHPTPIWAEVEGETIEGWSGYWCLCQKGVVLTPSSFATRAEQMGGVKFYSYPPSHINQEAWDPCDQCKSCESCYKLDSFHCFECKEMSEFVPDSSFCGKCGRPRTLGAWAELEKRVRG